MSIISYQVRTAIMSLLLAASLISVTAAKTPQPKPAQTSNASAQDKAKACNDLADKKGLKDKDRQTFMQSCLNKASDTGSGTNVSQQDKAKTCNSLADKKNLTGADRRSFYQGLHEKSQPPVGWCGNSSKKLRRTTVKVSALLCGL